ncbi:poly-beta-1,6-N-acetyl-D-glucosamine biosynthesis protein PgaD [Rhodoferax koreense]|uniref:Poly-beta-1,6-N-acetyl-D-glucosamine biosynthesis protein PgaD n=1 Tax=Rhodoferax koreensis TaxID=1842727 RepID=A0A1P8JT43_9BURK|nr:poly-beta-1,6-N-acetyl-D-glucosamine biosynthesis protein PgaD [Rhodoferax koreense]APW36910.1 poly-beta-1,6-N-acetyl-D-glucosamine biosynthesis protein PgaD [Rhodoferax koreense]
MKTPLIIERPDLQAWQQKALFSALTAAFWIAWVFLWLPLVTLGGWLFFGYQFRFHMVELNGYARFLNVLMVYAIVIAVMGGALMLWAVYNHIRFRGVDRRKETPPPTDHEMGDWARHPVEVMAQWREFSVMTVHHDAQGSICRVEPALNLRNIEAATKPTDNRRLLRVV